VLPTSVSLVLFQVLMEPIFEFRGTRALRQEQIHLEWGKEAERAEGTLVMPCPGSTPVSMLHATV